MPTVSAFVSSKTLHRNVGWKFLCGAVESEAAVSDDAQFDGLPPFDVINIYNCDVGRGMMVSRSEESFQYAWMFDEPLTGDGFTQIYVRPKADASDIHITLGKKLEEGWLRELDRVLDHEHLEIQLSLSERLGRPDTQSTKGGGKLLTFQKIPELSVVQKAIVE